MQEFYNYLLGKTELKRTVAETDKQPITIVHSTKGQEFQNGIMESSHWPKYERKI
jgi:hypothetical protein